MPLNYPRSGYFLALYTLIQLVLNLGRADFSRNQKTHDLRTQCTDPREVIPREREDEICITIWGGQSELLSHQSNFLDRNLVNAVKNLNTCHKE